jgi:hypothetical protein
MPGYDQTGPAGYGPGTGRGLGPCGRGMAFRRGFSRGYGRGFCRWNYFGPYWYEPRPRSKEDEKKMLEADLKGIEAEKAEIQRRLRELE